MYEGIILAGGFGTRLKQTVPDLPKPMAPIAGKPFLEILLSTLSEKGFTRIILSLGFMADKIIDYFGDRFKNIELSYVIEDKPLGTGGAVRLAIEQAERDHVFVFNGDTYLDLEIEEVESLWQKNHEPIIIGREVEDTTRYGGLVVEEKKVRGFLEKNTTGRGLINGGCYVLGKDVLSAFPLNQAFSLEKDYFSQYVKENPIDLFIATGKFIDIGIPEDYLIAQTELKDI
jgi:D-glycero-alpha-D-manno-heptose 1-phosphate guanylyltransferase